jgi:hypothetical protein
MRRSRSSAISDARWRARSDRPPSAFACKRQAMRRNKNCLLDDFGTSPNSSRKRSLRAGILMFLRSSIERITAGSILLFLSLYGDHSSMNALLASESKRKQRDFQLDFNANWSLGKSERAVDPDRYVFASTWRETPDLSCFCARAER